MPCATTHVTFFDRLIASSLAARRLARPVATARSPTTAAPASRKRPTATATLGDLVAVSQPAPDPRAATPSKVEDGRPRHDHPTVWRAGGMVGGRSGSVAAPDVDRDSSTLAVWGHRRRSAHRTKVVRPQTLNKAPAPAQVAHSRAVHRTYRKAPRWRREGGTHGVRIPSTAGTADGDPATRTRPNGQSGRRSGRRRRTRPWRHSRRRRGHHTEG